MGIKPRFSHATTTGAMRRCYPLLVLPLLLAVPTAARAEEPAAGIVAELNRARADPQAYAAELLRFRSRFAGRIVREPGEPIDRVTVEGVRALDDAVAFLRRQPALGSLAPAVPLALAATDHVAQQGASGQQGHIEPNGSDPLGRVLRRGLRPFTVGEVIAYGPRTAEAVVRELIIDDGVADRGHRLAIFSPDFARAGAACGPHREYGTMCVVDLASREDAPGGARMMR